MQFNSLSKMNQLDSDLHLPPRKRLLAGFKKLNESSSSSSSTTSNSNGSSSVSTDVQTHLNNLLASPFNNQTSPEELMEATRSAAVLAVKAAKIARAMANEKALVSAKAIDSAKIALDLLDSFPKGACKKKNKKKKHVPVKQLYSKEEDLARTYSDFEENCQRNKKQKNDNDIVGVVDSESFYDGEEESDKKVIKSNEADSNLLSKRRGRVKLLKKLPLSICNTRNQENVTSLESTLPVAQPQEDGVVPVVIPGSSSRKCQDLKNQECVKQSKVIAIFK